VKTAAEYVSPGEIEKKSFSIIGEELGKRRAAKALTGRAAEGINKKVLAKYGGEAFCFMADDDVAAAAEAGGVTRAQASVDKAASLAGPLVFAVGNAPTALIRIHDLIAREALEPSLVIAAPVGFVNVEASKELFLDSPVPCIIARGRKGGSAVAAAIVNALLYY
jgi:precorrin-8X/cobalt-precorrin-8 methylmutase